jgi:hypothetical protein
MGKCNTLLINPDYNMMLESLIGNQLESILTSLLAPDLTASIITDYTRADRKSCDYIATSTQLREVTMKSESQSLTHSRC